MAGIGRINLGTLPFLFFFLPASRAPHRVDYKWLRNTSGVLRRLLSAATVTLYVVQGATLAHKVRFCATRSITGHVAANPAQIQVS